MSFEPTPPYGSGGGPIIDEETGAVVGMIHQPNRGTDLYGQGVPSERIFEVCFLFTSVLYLLIILRCSVFRD